MKGEPLAGWQAYHLYYHEDLGRAIDGFARPAVAACRECGLLARFFFIRYGFGGPHLRLRLEAVPGREAELDELVRRTAESFLAASPSRASRDPEEIRRTNANLAANDSQLEGDPVQPDNSLLAEPFVPEAGRYGGRMLLPSNLDYFQLSSADTFHFRDLCANLAKTQILPLCLLELLRPALGFAASRAELLDLTRYAAVWAKEDGDLFVRRGNEAYESSAPLFDAKVRSRLEHFLAGRQEWGPPLAAGARRLAWEARDLDADRRRMLAVGQIHMLANRLGLSNPEEIYLGQILSRSLEAMLDREPDLEDRLAGRLAATDVPAPLAAAVTASFAFAAPAGSAQPEAR
jgi:hypothetical protein